MDAREITAIIEAEIAGNWSLSNDHGVDLRKCLVLPRMAKCINTFPKMNHGKPLQMWIVLEEDPGSSDGYIIVFDEQRRRFGLALADAEMPTFLGFHGTFLATLRGM